MSRRKRSRGSIFTIIGLIVSTLTGGGFSGYLKPDLPFVGPLMQQASGFLGSTEAGEAALQVAIEHLGDESAKSSSSGGARLTGGEHLAHANQRHGHQTSAGARATYSQQAGGNQSPARLPPFQKPQDRIFIASFNIQVFGTSKLAKPQVMDILSQVVRQFDIVAIQEVRSKEDTILPRFLEQINADGSQYNFLISSRLGRTVSKEQYAFVYDTRRIEYDPSAVGVFNDPKDLLHREPFVTRFRTRLGGRQQPFSFWLVNIHTDPDEVKEEVAALADVFQAMQQARADEDDVILLGDLNASEKQLGPLGRLPGITCAVQGVMTNTRQTKCYDNLVFNAQRTSEYLGQWGVVNLEETFRISRSEALKVSDHFPVWAAFQATEATSGRRMANRNSAGLR